VTSIVGSKQCAWNGGILWAWLWYKNITQKFFTTQL